MNLKYISIKFN